MSAFELFKIMLLIAVPVVLICAFFYSFAKSCKGKRKDNDDNGGDYGCN